VDVGVLWDLCAAAWGLLDYLLEVRRAMAAIQPGVVVKARRSERRTSRRERHADHVRQGGYAVVGLEVDVDVGVLWDVRAAAWGLLDYLLEVRRAMAAIQPGVLVETGRIKRRTSTG